MLILGDAHADDRDNRKALVSAYRDADADRALQVGDLQCYEVPIPTWFIAGNNENFDVIEAMRRGDGSLPPSGNGGERPRLLASTTIDLEGVRVAGLSGNYAPTQYEKSRDELTGERRRHFVRADVERAMGLADVDVLLTHEAPHGVVYMGYDVGCDPIDDLVEALDPKLCLVGHYHRHVEGTVGETRVVSLAPVWESYYTLDPDTLELEHHETPTAGEG